ncbi:hypothetical protein DFJ58DRAFT_607984, partial [Suillus subalutaceus]|uniref:uncharacterized protein n=1 Tax=Suillus subalutaceus TaxID=48586 RepID=UPI001B87D0B0
RLASDPGLEPCPDFPSNIYQAIRARFVNQNNDNAQVVEILQAVWAVTNNTRKVQWQRQLQEDQAAVTKQQGLFHEEIKCQLQASLLEEDRKRNPLKYIPIPDRPRPYNIHHVLISDFAFQRVVEGQYVELYYWTGRGLRADPRLNYPTAADEGMGRSASPGSFTTAGAAHDASVIPDHSLTIMEFAQAVPRALELFQQCGWAAQRIQMLTAFWQAIMCHQYWNSTDPLEERALLVYQDKQRRAWHKAIPLTDG